MMTDRVTDYARAVVAGQVQAGKDQRNSCKRHLNDLKRQETEDFPYVWNVTSANKILQFAEMLEIAEGTRRQKLVLLPFQAFLLGSLFSWLNEKGYRRFRISYIEMASQNVSFMCAIESSAATYGRINLFPDGECSIYSSDTSKWIDLVTIRFGAKE